MAHMGAGFESANHDDLLRSLAYVSFQELATRISHRNTGKITKDPVCDQLLARIALDENLHMVFYRNLLAAALQVAPNQTMRAITEVVKSFEMPGSTIEDFTRKSVQIAMAGIYDLRLHHDDVLAPVLRAWGVFDVEGLDAEGEKAREELSTFLQGLDQAASRFEEKRSSYREKLTARGQAFDAI
jgi:acyl-[acyl-carrier-protein] desaturase